MMGSIFLIIVNSIQFKTFLYNIHEKSLNGDTKGMRNLIWRNFLESREIRKDFINRVTRYKPVKIINAFTQKLQSYVNFELTLNNYKIYIYNNTSSNKME